MEQKVEIDKREFALELLTRFNELRKTKKYCDFIIRVEGKDIPVHRCVISANSEYFDGMLSHDNKENNEGVVEIKEADPECVVKCVDFMYTGEATVSERKQRDLMHVAHMLRLHRLYKGVASFLKLGLGFTTFFSTREIARLYDCENLLETCNEFAVKNFEAIATFEDFKKLELSYVKMLLSSKARSVKDTVKLKALLLWINHDKDRNAALVDMMTHIDLQNVSLSYRRFVTENEPAMSGSVECLQQILKSMYDAAHVKSADIALRCQNFRQNDTHLIFLDRNTGKLRSFDPFQKVWVDMHKVHRDMQKKFCSAVSMDEYLYVFSNRKCFRLNYREHDAEWEQLAGSTSDKISVVELNGKIYGKQFHKYSNRVECYDPKKNAWNFIPDLKLMTESSAISSFDTCETIHSGALFIIGGKEFEEENIVFAMGQSNRVAQFNPATCIWSDAPSLRVARHSASAINFNTAIYVFGGYNGRRYVTDSAEILYPNTDAWQVIQLNNISSIGNFCNKFASFASFAINDKIYIVGNEEFEDARHINEYNPATKTFELVANRMYEYPLSSVALCL